MSLLYIGCNQLIDWLASVLPKKVRWVGGRIQIVRTFCKKKKKNSCCQSVTEHILLSRCSSNHQLIIKIMVKKLIISPFYSAIPTHSFCIICICHACLYLSEFIYV